MQSVSTQFFGDHLNLAKSLNSTDWGRLVHPAEILADDRAKTFYYICLLFSETQATKKCPFL